VKKKIKKLVNNPIVTIIVPVHNHERYIGRCLRSILNQNYDREKFEIIVVDDGSTDRSEFAINIFANEIVFLKNKKKMGLPYSLNKALKKVKSTYFVRVDSDDYINENFLLFLTQYIELNKYMDAVACDYFLIDKKEEIIERANCIKKPIGCGIIFRIDQIVKLGLYDRSFLLHEDLDLRSRFSKKHKIHRLEMPLYRYRQHEENISKNLTNNKFFRNKLKKKLKKSRQFST
jgi:glycosyltransferase involved in cell wall biosynthesis